MLKKILITTVLIGMTSVLFAETEKPEVFIRLHNQHAYKEGSDVTIQVELRNTGVEPINFKLADNRVHNIKLDVRTLSNDPMEECDECIKDFISSQPVYYSQIRLKPGELFSFLIKVDHFVNIQRSGKYFVKAWFYPEFRTKLKTPSSSNRIDFEIIPPEPMEEDLKLEIKSVDLTLQPKPIYPDEVVKWTINARIAAEKAKNSITQNHEWEKYFLYLDIEELLIKSDNKKREYLKLSETERMNRVAEYRQWLQNGKKDKDLLLVPTDWELVKTSYTDNSAIVVVKKTFDKGRFLDKKQYSYYLRKIDNIWKIYDYSIINMMGSENR